MLITQPLILHVICIHHTKRMDIGSNFMEVSECWRSEKEDVKLSDCIPSFLLLVPAHLRVSAQFHYLRVQGKGFKIGRIHQCWLKWKSLAV